MNVKNYEFTENLPSSLCLIINFLCLTIFSFLKFFHNFFLFSQWKFVHMVNRLVQLVVAQVLPFSRYGARQPNDLKKLFFQRINTFFELYALFSPPLYEISSLRYFSTQLPKTLIFSFLVFPHTILNFHFNPYECYKF